MPYNDGDYTYVIYTNGTKDIPSQELKNILSFLVDSSEENAKSSALTEIHDMITNMKRNREIGIHKAVIRQQIKRAMYITDM